MPRSLPILLLLLLAGCGLMFNSPPRVRQVALADLDGDGAPDAYLANGRYGEPYTFPTEIDFQALFNDGTGAFASRTPPIESNNYTTVALADFNGDGAVDVALGGQTEAVLLNDGAGSFTRRGRLMQHPDTGAFQGRLALADLDGDGSVDIFGAFCCGGVAFDGPGKRWLLFSGNQVWLNNGRGNFRHTGQLLGRAGSNGVALGDLNGDGAIDAFVANGQTNVSVDGAQQYDTPNVVWLNDGSGQFHDSGQPLGRADSRAVALADVNGDGTLDAVVGNAAADEVWLNDGTGTFRDDGQRLGTEVTREVFLADLDGDGDVDLFAAGEEVGRVWLNDGSGRFAATEARVRYDEYDAVTLGDVDLDGDADVFVAGVRGYRVWLNGGDGRFSRAD
ncbi:MAG: VCBS repeat-containing protein [Anaerolineales bacterium]|nr:VCBS repeat-containing protein [Anaerolineales bacterium]